MRVDLTLHLERRDVLAAPADVVLDPVDEEVVLVRVLPECVACVQPQVAEQTQAGLWIAVVLGGQQPRLG